MKYRANVPESQSGCRVARVRTAEAWKSTGPWRLEMAYPRIDRAPGRVAECQGGRVAQSARPISRPTGTSYWFLPFSALTHHIPSTIRQPKRTFRLM